MTTDGSARVPVGCGSGHGGHTGTVYETIIDGRLHWVLEYDCGGATVEAMGWDDTPEEYRTAIIEQDGAHLLRLPEGLGGSRVAVLRVLREGGLELGEAAGAAELLRGSGLSGTRVELDLLAARLRAVGTSTEVARTLIEVVRP